MLDVSRETQDKLALYEELIQRWTRRINLISSGTIEEIRSRHIDNSIWIVQNAPIAETWLDVGSGAGLPGVVAAILRPRTRVTCVEKDRRKCEFLRTVRRELDLDLVVIADRLQNVEIARPDVISARALASLETLFEMMHPHMHDATTLVLPKGQSWKSEMDLADRSWTYDLEVIDDPNNPGSALLNIGNLERRVDEAQDL
ncbi:MAG: 16S rRNA (guanine(527)-N(7))-methyltransferase RsmG [Pseudomonadota bacterium]